MSVSLPPKEVTCDCGHTITLSKKYEWCEKCMHKIFYNAKDKRMDKLNTYYIWGAIIAAVLFLMLMVPQAFAAKFFMNRRLLLNGNIRETLYIRTHIPEGEKMFHDSNVDFARISMRLEALYKLKKSEDLNINLFGGVRYHYMLETLFDEQQKRGIPHRAYKDYKILKGEEIITNEAIKYEGLSNNILEFAEKHNIDINKSVLNSRINKSNRRDTEFRKHYNNEMVDMLNNKFSRILNDFDYKFE